MDTEKAPDMEGFTLFLERFAHMILTGNMDMGVMYDKFVAAGLYAPKDSFAIRLAINLMRRPCTVGNWEVGGDARNLNMGSGVLVWARDEADANDCLAILKSAGCTNLNITAPA